MRLLRLATGVIARRCSVIQCTRLITTKSTNIYWERRVTWELRSQSANSGVGDGFILDCQGEHCDENWIFQKIENSDDLIRFFSSLEEEDFAQHRTGLFQQHVYININSNEMTNGKAYHSIECPLYSYVYVCVTQ